MAAGGNGYDERLGEGLTPYPMLGEELIEIILLFGSCHGLELVDGLLYGGFGVAVGRQKARVGGDLVAAQASLFIDDEPFDLILCDGPDAGELGASEIFARADAIVALEDEETLERLDDLGYTPAVQARFEGESSALKRA